MSVHYLQKAIDVAGSQKVLAAKISTPKKKYSQQNIWWWLKKSGRVPAEVAPLIERATGVNRRKLRPDIEWAA